MCKWNEMQRAASNRDASNQAAIEHFLATSAPTRAPVGMRNITPANMKKLVRGETTQESVA